MTVHSPFPQGLWHQVDTGNWPINQEFCSTITGLKGKQSLAPVPGGWDLDTNKPLSSFLPTVSLWDRRKDEVQHRTENGIVSSVPVAEEILSPTCCHPLEEPPKPGPRAGRTLNFQSHYSWKL